MNGPALDSLSGWRDASAVLDAGPTAVTAATGRAELEAIVNRVCAHIAPLWPLRHFVAVNPFLGLTSEGFEAACARMWRVLGVPMAMPRAFYRAAIEAGRIERTDLSAALAEAGMRPAYFDGLASEPDPAPPQAITVAELLDRSRTMPVAAFVVDEIAKWLAAYWDEGQAAWRMPWQSLRPYPAWRAAMRHDRAPQARGLRGFRAALADLPEEPLATIELALDRLALPAGAVENYLHRALASIGGWAAYARYLAWNKGLHGQVDDAPVHCLAIRVAWDAALFDLHCEPEFRADWRVAARAMATSRPVPDAGLVGDVVLQNAYERGFQRRLVADLMATEAASQADTTAARPALQAVFCIDVRSEVYRRALEAVTPEVETVGFAGFFGFPIEYVPIGHRHGGARCPVLLTPKFVVCEAVKHGSEPGEAAVLQQRVQRRRLAEVWKAFKTSAVSSFSFVETIGLVFGAKLVADGAGLTRTVAHPGADGIAPDTLRRLGPRLSARTLGERETGFTTEQKVAAAEAVLRAMSLADGFARLVMLAGHGSTTVNNPHATGLDCGACGGHSGEANARVAASILNDAEVRAQLAAHGICLPEDTWFVAALHDTTTDEVTFYDLDDAPTSHLADVVRLRRWTSAASARARAERAASLGIKPGPRLDARITRRGRDWSQVRPEWGLAGNAAFIAATRARTKSLDLKGRAFLHSYDHRLDADGSVLELIMTAPMVVASWINLQYYGSTVDNSRLGAGNKVLHNVVGTVGVLEGNAGDLRVGLPWQSIHDGRRLVHEPLRLNVVIEAPQAAIDRVIARHAAVRDLVENRWVHLFAIAEDGGVDRYAGRGAWVSECSR